MPIQTLPPLLINQIAAGEVIERPASVVKELVENALDAGATRLDITIEDGGRQMIRVADNGLGIPEHELSLALAPHATSKLSTADQLSSIQTLGFRGEALASIASVSRLRITSRATVDGQLADAGAVIQASGDRREPLEPVGCGPGSVVQVSDLFFNTPARRKFLRGSSSEFGHISDTISRTAMAHPNVGFKLTHGSRTTIDLPANQSRHRRCVHLIGNELDEALLELELVEPKTLNHDDTYQPVSIWGLAGLPVMARSSSKFIYICVNGRPIQDRSLNHAVKEAYRGLIAPNQYPVAVIFIDMDPRAVDVNVHPAKTNVRFADTNKMHALVLTALRQCLKANNLTPTASQQEAAHAGLDGQQPLDNPSSSQGPASINLNTVSIDSFVDHFKRLAPKQKGFVFQQVKQALANDDPDLLATETDLLTQTDPPAPTAPQVLQVHKSYLITQDDQGILIIDQHALHERVMFEQLRQRVLGDQSLESQRLLTPAIVSASPTEQALLEELDPLLQRIGIEAAPIGPNAVAIHAFPSFLFERNVDPVEFLEQVIDKAQEGQINLTDSNNAEAALHEALDMMACKAAVKAGDQMNPPQLASLLQQRQQIDRASSCPHGRPTAFRMTLSELAKRFDRT